MAGPNWRTINVDLLDPESSTNFAPASLAPAAPLVTAAEVHTLGSQVRQLLRSGDAEGALRGALESAPYGGDEAAKVSSNQRAGAPDLLSVLLGAGAGWPVQAS